MAYTHPILSLSSQNCRVKKVGSNDRLPELNYAVHVMLTLSTWCRWDILWEFYTNSYSQPLLFSKQSGVRIFLKVIFFLYCYNTYHYIKRTICFWIWLSIYNFSAIWLRISLSIKLGYMDWKLVCITQKEKP